MNEDQQRQFLSTLTVQQVAAVQTLMPPILTLLRALYDVLTPEQRALLMLDLAREGK